MKDDSCKKYSTECGADYWLEFNENDPPEYQALNGKCVVLVGQDENGLVETDEYDPLGLGLEGMLWVSRDKLKREENWTPTNRNYISGKDLEKENKVVVGQLARAIEKVLEAKKNFDAIENKPAPEECDEYFELESAENHLINVIKKMAGDDNE